jgi:hypothetical protein
MKTQLTTITSVNILMNVYKMLLFVLKIKLNSLWGMAMYFYWPLDQGYNYAIKSYSTQPQTNPVSYYSLTFINLCMDWR